MDTVMITFTNDLKKEYKKGIKLKEIIDDIQDNYKLPIIVGKFKNHLISYQDSIVKSGKLELYDVTTNIGNKVYERGLIYLFVSSVNDVIGKDATINVKHTLDKGLFCEINKEVSAEQIELIKKNMQKKVGLEIPFLKVETSRLDAIKYFKSINREDSAKTLFYNTNDFITLYKFNGTYNYVIGELPSDTSVLKDFDLTLIDGKRIVLRYPHVLDQGKIVKYTHHEKFFKSLQEYSDWGKILNINNIGDLNEQVINNGAGDIIMLSEMLQDYKLLNIAEEITLKKDEIKYVLIAGPSSSGKTTTSRKLSLYLKTLGLNPIPLSLDDYFTDIKDRKKDEDGKPIFESIEAIDVELFNEQIYRLENGEKVNTPTFDFVEGKRIFNRPIQLNKNDILIIEGLHALNKLLIPKVNAKRKFKIYISPLAYLNLDNNNRISMTDIRLLRRMIRDNRTRGFSPNNTLELWKNVRKGEENYVFMFQDEADAVFNTFLVYELGVIKTYVEPLLFSIKEDEPEYLTALRLIELLRFVLPIPSEDIPRMSILREFIGNSYFEK